MRDISFVGISWMVIEPRSRWRGRVLSGEFSRTFANYDYSPASMVFATHKPHSTRHFEVRLLISASEAKEFYEFL